MLWPMGLAVVILMTAVVRWKRKGRDGERKVVKKLRIKKEIEERVMRNVEGMETDLKSFQGLRYCEIEAITLKNTKLNSGMKSSSTKSIPEINVEKIDKTIKLRTFTPKTQNNSGLKNCYDFKSLSSFSTVNSEDQIIDNAHDSKEELSLETTIYIRKQKRVSFN